MPTQKRPTRKEFDDISARNDYLQSALYTAQLYLAGCVEMWGGEVTLSKKLLQDIQSHADDKNEGGIDIQKVKLPDGSRLLKVSARLVL